MRIEMRGCFFLACKGSRNAAPLQYRLAATQFDPFGIMRRFVHSKYVRNTLYQVPRIDPPRRAIPTPPMRPPLSPAMISAILAALAAIATAAIIAWYQLTQVAVAPSQDGLAGFQPLVEVGGPFELVDHSGKAVTDADYRGEFLLVVFGYTFCPDICPTELQNVATALDELGDKAVSVRPLFITIDPERDTVEYISQYVAHFHPRLVGLTGTSEQIKRAADVYRVFYAKVDDPQATEYLMDHSSFVYLMGRDGKFLTMFSHGTDPSRMAQTIGAYLDQAS